MNAFAKLFARLPRRPRSAGAIDKPYRFLRLAGAIEIAPLAEELENATLQWSPAPWKWHHETKIAVLRAGSPELGVQALVSGVGTDHPALDRLPKLRAFLDEAFGAPVPVAWLGLSPPGSHIYLHGDNTEHWDEHHRAHVPLLTNQDAKLCVAGHFLHLAAGHAWVFNNSKIHGVVNRGPTRIHLVVDLPPTDDVERRLADAEVFEGEPDAALYEELERDPLETLDDGHIVDASLRERLRRQ